MAEEQIVTPWEVSGDIDYDRLIKEFGTEPIDDKLIERIKKHAGEVHPYLRRKIFFCHRDMNWILDEFESVQGHGRGVTQFIVPGKG